MESYVIRIYREGRKQHRNLVGIVEEVGVNEKKAFTNLNELWGILRSIKAKPGEPKQRTIFLSDQFEIEKRNEVRLSKGMPCTLICNNKKMKAETVNCSKKGVAIKISDSVPLLIGDTLKFRIKNNDVKAQVKWVDCKSDSSVTLAGLEIVNGKLNIGGT